MQNLPRVGGFIQDVPDNLLRLANLNSNASKLPFGTQPSKAVLQKQQVMPTDQIERRYQSQAYGNQSPLPKTNKNNDQLLLDIGAWAEKKGFLEQKSKDSTSEDALIKDIGVWAEKKGLLKPQEPSVINNITNLVTGNDRKTAETEALPDYAGMPELNDLTSMAGWKTGLGTLLSNPEETAKVIKANYPNVEVKQDQKGNYLLKSSADNNWYAIKPGFQISDIPRAIGGVAAFTPAGRATSILGAGAAGAATQAAIEGSQSATGGEFNPSEVVTAGVLGAATPAIINAVKAAPSAIKGVANKLISKKSVAQQVVTPKSPLTMSQPVTNSIEAPAAKTIIQDAKDAGVRVLTSDVRPPKTFIGKTIQKAGESVPIAGTGGVRAAQQAERVNAVKNLLTDFGADDVAKATDDVTKDLIAKRSADLTKYASLKNEVIDRLDSAGVVPVNRTINVIDQELAQIKSKKTNALMPVVKQLEDFKQSIEQQGLRNIEDLRKQLGESFKSPDLVSVKSVADKATNKIYGAIREDMGNFIKTVGERKDITKWGVANKRLSDMMSELNTNSLKATLAKGEATPEVIGRMLYSKNKSEVELLQRNLSQNGRKNARSAILAKAADNALIDGVGGERIVSPDLFVKNFRKLEPSFKAFFNADDYKRVEGLARVISATKRASEATLAPPTGVQAVPFVAGSFLTDILGGFGAATTTAVTVGAMARAFESKAVRNLLLLLSKTKNGSAGEKSLMKKLATEIKKLPKEQRRAFAALLQVGGAKAAQTEINKKRKQQKTKKG